MNTRSSFSIGWLILTTWDCCLRNTSRLLSTAKAKLILQLLGCRYGCRLRVDGKILIRAREKHAIELGQNVTINSRPSSNLVGLTGCTILECFCGGRIAIGDNVGLSSVVFSSRSGISVGNNVLIGGNARVYDHDYHPTNPALRRGDAVDRQKIETVPIVIGDDVFIGANAIILKGVHIGDRSVIGAGSVVTLKDIPPDSLVAGNPARIVRRLQTG
jgi:acetyltransferase-like isoleucine patch superfamily enzyme